MGLKLRAPYILLAISLVVLAIGIILIVIDSTPDRTTETPGITTLVDRTVVFLSWSEEKRVDFNISRTGVLRGTVKVESGGSIGFCLYKGSEIWWAGEEGYSIIRSSFETPIDEGNYCLVITRPPFWVGGTREENTLSVYLEFEG